jgi:hypothetical protein
MYRVTTDRGIRYSEGLQATAELLEMIRGELDTVMVEKLDSEGIIMERSELSTVLGRGCEV